MELDKIRDLSDDDLKGEAAKAAEQLFRVRFAKSLGKQEGLSKVRTRKLDSGRCKTIARQRQIEHARQAAGAVVGRKHNG